MKKRVVSILCALCMVAGVFAVGTSAAERFGDVKTGDWYYEAVTNGVEKGLFKGTADGVFSPNMTLTREMFVTVLYRYAGEPDFEQVGDALPFADVTVGAWYETAVKWAYGSGIVKGVNDTSYGIGLAVTREQAATILVRYLESGRTTALITGDDYLADASDISGFALTAVYKAMANGIMQGRGNSRFAPKADMTRAEAATVFVNVAKVPQEHFHIKVEETRYLPATGGIKYQTITRCPGCDLIWSEGETQIGRMPVLELTGDVSEISKENEVVLKASYNAADQTFDSYCKLKWQGASSLDYEKKNFNIKLFKDADAKEKNKVNLGWGKENKYCLKANYIDYTQSHNLVSAKLWGEMVRSRETVPAQLADLVNGGAVDGYPVMLYINDEYQGLYTCNIPKDKWMLESGDYKVKGIMMTNNWEPTCNFTASADPAKEDWEIEENAEETDDWMWNRMNETIAFVQNNAGAAFKSGIGDYIDVDSYIDYMVFCMAGTMRDNTAKNMMFVTYDGLKWYVNMYDMDTSWGLYWDGSRLYSTGMMVPQVNGTTITVSEVSNLMWTRMFESYAPEIRARYLALRKTVLSNEHIMEQFRDFTAMIPDWAYAAEKRIYPLEPGFSINSVSAVSTYIDAHMKLLDTAIAKFPVR